MALFETIVEVAYLLCRSSSAFELLVTCMIACADTFISDYDPAVCAGCGLRRIVVLNCTVFNAATSHPNDCMTNAAMVLPTYLVCRQARLVQLLRLYSMLQLTHRLPWIAVSRRIGRCLRRGVESLHDWRLPEPEFREPVVL